MGTLRTRLQEMGAALYRRVGGKSSSRSQRPIPRGNRCSQFRLGHLESLRHRRHQFDFGSVWFDFVSVGSPAGTGSHEVSASVIGSSSSLRHVGKVLLPFLVIGYVGYPSLVLVTEPITEADTSWEPVPAGDPTLTKSNQTLPKLNW
jgi:hypothetical protein